MNIIFIVNIENSSRPGRNASYSYSIESWKRWADGKNATVIVLEEPIVDLEKMTPIIQRHYVFDLLDFNGIKYEQVLMVDADTIVHPNCPNFFDDTEMKFSAIHNEGDYDWLIRSVENYEYEFYGNDRVDMKWIWKYINAGFIITNASYKLLHETVIETYWNNFNKIIDLQKKYGVGTDQPLLNMIIRHGNWDVNILPYKYNMQDLPRKNILDDRMLFTQIPGVYHFNAIEGGPSQSNYWIEKTYRYFYN
jgi:hypothetical protein